MTSKRSRCRSNRPPRPGWLKPRAPPHLPIPPSVGSRPHLPTVRSRLRPVRRRSMRHFPPTRFRRRGPRSASPGWKASSPKWTRPSVASTSTRLASWIRFPILFTAQTPKFHPMSAKTPACCGSCCTSSSIPKGKLETSVSCSRPVTLKKGKPVKSFIQQNVTIKWGSGSRFST